MKSQDASFSGKVAGPASSDPWKRGRVGPLKAQDIGGSNQSNRALT